jgi:hypothetical protein
VTHRSRPERKKRTILKKKKKKKANRTHTGPSSPDETNPIAGTISIPTAALPAPTLPPPTPPRRRTAPPRAAPEVAVFFVASTHPRDRPDPVPVFLQQPTPSAASPTSSSSSSSARLCQNLLLLLLQQQLRPPLPKRPPSAGAPASDLNLPLVYPHHQLKVRFCRNSTGPVLRLPLLDCYVKLLFVFSM